MKEKKRKLSLWSLENSEGGGEEGMKSMTEMQGIPSMTDKPPMPGMTGMKKNRTEKDQKKVRKIYMLSQELVEKVKLYGWWIRTSESAVVEEALRSFFAKKGDELKKALEEKEHWKKRRA